MTAEARELIDASTFSHTYHLGKSLRRELFGGLDLKIKKNEFVVVLGPSGCGKSTLLRVLGGLLEPSEGLLDRKQNTFAYVFQEARLIPWRSVEANLQLVREVQYHPRLPLSQIQRSLEQVHLGTETLSLYPAQLSGGMKMRVAVARALIQNVDVYLFDEPFSALDETVRLHLQDEIRQIFSATGKTFIFVTHSLTEAVSLADRIVLLDRDGNSREIIELKNFPRTPHFRQSESFRRELLRLEGLA